MLHFQCVHLKGVEFSSLAPSALATYDIRFVIYLVVSEMRRTSIVLLHVAIRMHFRYVSPQNGHIFFDRPFGARYLGYTSKDVPPRTANREPERWVVTKTRRAFYLERTFPLLVGVLFLVSRRNLDAA